MVKQQPLLSNYKLGSLALKNRVVMAPLTRMRALPGRVPGPMNATYYHQRSTMGLLITEATQVSKQGSGYPFTPGIYTREQIDGWKLITKAVHQENSYIFMQLYHCGRISHPCLQIDNALPVAPSAVKPEGEAVTEAGMQPFVTPRALETDELPGIVDQFRQGAANAKAAGFDGIELHGANGYLLDQFLRDGSNQRTDAYGGPVENRCRLLLEIIEAVMGVFGTARVGVRISPHNTFNDMEDSDPERLFNYLAECIDHLGLAYLHVIEPRIKGNEPVEGYVGELVTKNIRKKFKGTIITAGGWNQETGNKVIEDGIADLVAFGRFSIANPDLPERFAAHAPLNPYDRSTFYGGDEHGYIDYPFLINPE